KVSDRVGLLFSQSRSAGPARRRKCAEALQNRILACCNGRSIARFEARVPWRAGEPVIHSGSALPADARVKTGTSAEAGKNIQSAGARNAEGSKQRSVCPPGDGEEDGVVGGEERPSLHPRCEVIGGGRGRSLIAIGSHISCANFGDDDCEGKE